ncbi:MAG: hypothetical protein HWE10_02565 [Gammaproteobacteria bacterium]|nr:hypothetical protein [Gammaproteobacteria bacterium]
MLRLLALLLFNVLVLSACVSKIEKLEMDEYYLRSQFTFWEAQDAFKFRYNEEQDILYLKAKVQADGNPYHLIVADRAWTASNNCGYRNPKDKVLHFNQWLLLECNYDHELNATTPIQTPIEFEPKTTGEFLFEVSLLNGKPDQLRVSKVKKASNIQNKG